MLCATAIMKETREGLHGESAGGNCEGVEKNRGEKKKQKARTMEGFLWGNDRGLREKRRATSGDYHTSIDGGRGRTPVGRVLGAGNRNLFLITLLRETQSVTFRRKRKFWDLNERRHNQKREGRGDENVQVCLTTASSKTGRGNSAPINQRRGKKCGNNYDPDGSLRGGDPGVLYRLTAKESLVNIEQRKQERFL